MSTPRGSAEPCHWLIKSSHPSTLVIDITNLTLPWRLLKPNPCLYNRRNQPQLGSGEEAGDESWHPPFPSHPSQSRLSSAALQPRTSTKSPRYSCPSASQDGQVRHRTTATVPIYSPAVHCWLTHAQH